MSRALKINPDGSLGWEASKHKFGAIPTSMCLRCCWSIPSSIATSDDKCCGQPLNRFDSKREAERYQELLMLRKIDLIGPIKLQPEFELPQGFVYRADFSYVDKLTKKRVIEDVKGFQTKEFRLKLKCMRHAFPNLDLRIIS